MGKPFTRLRRDCTEPRCFLRYIWLKIDYKTFLIRSKTAVLLFLFTIFYTFFFPVSLGCKFMTELCSTALLQLRDKTHLLVWKQRIVHLSSCFACLLSFYNPCLFVFEMPQPSCFTFLPRILTCTLLTKLETVCRAMQMSEIQTEGSEEHCKRKWETLP